MSNQTVTIEIRNSQSEQSNGELLGLLLAGRVQIADIAGALEGHVITVTVEDTSGGMPVSQDMTPADFAKIL